MKYKIHDFICIVIIISIVLFVHLCYFSKQAFGENSQSEYFITISGSNADVFDSRGHKVMSLSNLASRSGSPSAVILNQNLYWRAKVTEGLNILNHDHWTELRVTNLQTNETKVIIADEEIEFVFNHKKSIMAVSHSSYNTESHEGRAAVSIIELRDNTQKDIVQDIKNYTTGQYDITGWSLDDSTLCFTFGIVGYWDVLIVYKNNKVMYVPEVHGGEDTIVDCNFGWVVYSDFPEIYDSISREEYERSGKMNTLWLYDIFRKKRVKVATSVASQFDPKWKAPSKNTREFLYYINGKSYKTDPLALLDSANTKTTKAPN